MDEFVFLKKKLTHTDRCIWKMRSHFIPYGCMVDEFQHIVYNNPDLTPDERHAAWKKLEEEYKPHLDYEGDPFMEKRWFLAKNSFTFMILRFII